MGWSSAGGINPMPTKFIEYITMSIHKASDVASQNSQAGNIEDPTI